MKLWQLRAVVPGAVGVLLSMPIVAQEPMASDRPGSGAGPSIEPTMIWVVPYPDEIYAVPYSCYRVRRCSGYDLYYFRDRPNRLTRLAPEPPADQLPPSIE